MDLINSDDNMDELFGIKIYNDDVILVEYIQIQKIIT